MIRLIFREIKFSFHLFNGFAGIEQSETGLLLNSLDAHIP